MRSFSKSIIVPCFAFVISGLWLLGCPETPPPVGTCVPNSTQACVCRTGGMGVQACLPNGTFEACGNCKGETGGAGGAGGSSSGTAGTGGAGGGCHTGVGVPMTCGNGTVDDPAEQCDDGNCVATDACNNNCKLPYCGDHVVQMGEMCDGTENCPSDCGVVDAGPPDADAEPPCAGKLVFAGFAAAQIGAFSFGGQNGLDAATAACQSMGAFGMCDYEQWKQLENSPAMYPIDVTNLGTAIPVGTCQDVWLQRTTVATGTEAATCPGGMSAPGPGGNCNNWNYPTNHLADGEHVNICNMAGAITYTYNIDCDTIFDAMNPGPHQNQVLTCGAMHPIPCCFEKCIP